MRQHKNSKIIFNKKEFSSNEIAMYVSAIESNLRSIFGRETFKVGILLNRSIDLFATILAVLRTNGTYILVEPTLPPSLIQYMLDDAKVDVLVLQSSTQINFPFTGSVIHIDNVKLEYTDFHRSLSTINHCAYIVYTSGSTGKPKGVEITRKALLNFIEGISEIIDFSPGKRIASFTAVSFDIFFLESVMALYKGLTVVLATEEEQHNPRFMAKLIMDNNVDMIQMTPSRIQLLLNYDKELLCLKKVKEIMIGGEPFPPNLLRTLQEKTTAKIYNMYGPTETTIWSTVSDVTNKDRIDIGHPIKNTEIYIVDESLSILSDGEMGEICIAGKGLAKGYVGLDDLTTEKFIHLPQKPNIRVYRTGDMGRYLPDGNIEYLGRIDNQVKIRGHRIELEEIETHINQFDGINQSIVTVVEMSETDKVLEAFYTSDSTIEQSTIAEYLLTKLPRYMVPVVFRRVENFIQTANGKIDRRRVLECVEINVQDSVPNIFATSELNETQKKALKVIISELDSTIGDVTLETSFINAGIDSITFIRIVVALESEFGFEFDDEMLLITQFPTIKSMIEYVASKIK